MTDFTAIPILVPGKLNPDTLATLKERFDVVQIDRNSLADLDHDRRQAIRGVAQSGGFTAEMIDALPNLEIIANFGVGYDDIDAAHAAKKGVMVTNTPDVLTDEVADTTIALLLMTVRELNLAETHLREGRWHTEGSYRLTPTTLRGRTVGIMGLGRIGLAIARRLEPFGVTIAYHNRSPRDDVSYPYHETLLSLAEAVDTLIVAAPGSAETEKAVDAAILRALGPTGVLVNIGRGTVVDEAALIAALTNGTIQAAGLDVFEDEPRVPAELIALANTVLLPHVASASVHTRRLMGDLVIENLSRWFAGDMPPTAVREAREAGIAPKGEAG